MIQNNLKIAFRSLRAHKFYSLLNILGIALGMSGCLTLILIIRDQLSYDRFHPNSERTYRVLEQQSGNEVTETGKSATTPFPLAESLKQDFSVVEKTARLVRGIDGNDTKTAGGLTLPLTGYFTEPSFFEVFGFTLEQGDPATALAEPHTMVITRKTAERFFGQENPIGKTLDVSGWGIFRITGIATKLPHKSHIGYECLASAATLVAKDNSYKPEDAELRLTDNWQNRWVTLTYVRVLPDKTRADLEAALAAVGEKVSRLSDDGTKTVFFAQHISKITPYPELLVNEIGLGFPWFIIWGLMAFVALLILFPCLNYANLAVARALERAREVGVRKVIGARSSDLTGLFLTESVLTAMIALVVAWGLHHILNSFLQRKLLSEMNLRGSDPISFKTDLFVGLCFVAFALLIGLLSGWLPARRLAKMHPAMAIRSQAGDAFGRQRLGWRAVMTVGQFAVSLIFMIVVGGIWRQLDFFTVADYGFQKENLLTVPLYDNKLETMRSAMAQDHRVSGICASSILIAGNSMQTTALRRKPGAEGQNIAMLDCDPNYVPVMKLRLVAGENFGPQGSQNDKNTLLLNEKALPLFQLGTPAEAVGQTLWLNDTTPMRVAGVLADFHFRPMKEAVSPLAIFNQPQNCGMLQIRLVPGDPRQQIAALESVWKQIDRNHPFEAVFMEEKMRDAFSDIELLGGLIGFFAVLGLSLACLGLLGMVAHTVGARIKEIGIRKVLGASVAQVFLLLSKRFLWMLGAAMLIALPFGWYLSEALLSNFAYHVSPDWIMPLSCAGIMLIFGLLAVGIQSIQAALSNPVETLKSE